MILNSDHTGLSAAFKGQAFASAIRYHFEIAETSPPKAGALCCRE